MEKLLFTGGTGFLGKNVMPILKEKYEVVTCGITSEDMIKANLAKELMETGLNEKEIKEALNMNDEEISLFREIKERRENFLSML